MAGNARFHDKHHRTNHHTLSTDGFPDSATDPIASPSQPFQGDFVVNGVLSSSRGLDVLSANYGGDVYCENIHVRDTTFTDFISGTSTETIISDGALTGFGPNTLTMDFSTAIYAKTPIVNFTNSISAASAIYTNFANFFELSSTSISAKDIITNTLSTISLTSNDILTNNITATTLDSQSILSDSILSLEISATDVVVTNNITVSGNCLIYGNLSALGDLTEIETTLHSSSSFSVTNTDISLPALTINQEGTGDIVVLNYSSVPNFLKIDIEKLTINGKISALSGIHSDVSVTSPNISSITDISNSVFSTVSSNSANWESTYSSVSSISSNWDSTYSSVYSNSANWDSTYSTVSSNSANWESTYSSVSSISSNWESTYSSVSSNSANWESTYSTVSSNSANWESTYSSVSSISANWESTYSTVSSNSANWESTYSTVSSNSANWESTKTTVNSNSSNWESTYSTVSSNSANWESTKTTINSNSANWESTYSTVSSNSDNWESTKTTVNSNSANWESTYSTVSSNSAQWLSGNSTLSFVASTIHVEKLSAHNLFLSNTLFVSVTSITGAPSTTLLLDTNCPSYIFASVSATGTFAINLPAITSNNKGMFFHIKNTSPLNTEIIAIHDSGGTPISFGSTLNGNDNHCTQVVWDGNTWQTIFTF